MPRRSPPKPRTKTHRVLAASPRTSVSWMALVAATTLGLPSVQRVRTEISGPSQATADEAGEYRLIVQSYDPTSLVDGVPALHARPVASAQRAVTAGELARGVAVDVVGIGDRPEDARVIVAWVEPGAADLDFDGRRARPGRGAFLGVAAADEAEGSARARVILSRQLA